MRLGDFKGSNAQGWLTGAELNELVAEARPLGEGGEGDVGDERAADLMGMALEPSTWRGRATHMAAICSFMKLRRKEFPLEERDLLAFLGYLYANLVTRTGPQIRAVSVPGYLSGIRLTHEALGLGRLPLVRDSLWLKAALEGYKKASDRNLPPTKIRVSIPPHVLYSVLDWAAGCRTTRRDLRDAALLVTATVFGLRPAGAQSILSEHVELDGTRMQVLVGALKGRTLEAALRRGGRTFYAPSEVPGHPRSVLQLMSNWAATRGTAAGPWFELEGLPACDLDAAARRLTAVVGYVAPEGCEVSGHSPRISAFSQAAMAQWSDVRLKIRFDWRNVADMADVYLDHRVRMSAASIVFFSPALPEPATGQESATAE